MNAEGASRLAEKVCVITGSGESMGRESALTFARERAAVVGCDLSVDAAEATADIERGDGGAMVSMSPCRLTDPADCRALVGLALSRPRRLSHPSGVAASEGERRRGREHGVAERPAELQAEQRDAGAARGPRVGGRHARRDAGMNVW
jgi:NAD(P)-dependent dehydrogenase (short-subunit alcohol dehydrogenase family)